MSTIASSSSSSNVGSGSSGAANSRSRRSLTAPAAVRGWVPSSSTHASTAVSFNIGGDATWTPSSSKSHTVMDSGRAKGKEKEENPGSGVEERPSGTPLSLPCLWKNANMLQCTRPRREEIPRHLRVSTRVRVRVVVGARLLGLQMRHLACTSASTVVVHNLEKGLT